MNSRAALAAAAIAVALACLAGCATGAAGPLAQSPTPTPSTSQTPVAVASEIVVTGEGLNLLDSSGVPIGSIVYTGDAADAVQQLTQFFGVDPVQSSYPGAMESSPATDYTWSGFTYRVSDHPAEPEWYNQSVFFTSAPAGITVHTGAGIAIGSAAADVEAVSTEPGTSQGGATYYRVEPYDRPDTGVSPDPGDLTDGILVIVDDATGLVTRISAPSPNYGV